jgi:hypothetical protein
MIGKTNATVKPGITPTGNINITNTNTTNVTNYATAKVVDENLVASNIKNGVTILGILGTFSGGGGSGGNEFDLLCNGGWGELTRSICDKIIDGNYIYYQ